ncbi:MAG: hypothetical protein IPK82_09585 [Polyangiaceae bacterium]|nr:hypothetical protein [Polyangiaceae bacterium]
MRVGAWIQGCLILCAGTLGACTQEPAPMTAANRPAEPHSISSATASETVPNTPPPSNEAVRLRAVFERVAAARELPILSDVAFRTLDRNEVAEMARKHVERELPRNVLANEAEVLVALGLVSPAYDAENGVYELLGASLTGLYEPAEKAMYLITDLSPAERGETLAHELVHALQDQHFELGDRLKYKAGEEERTSAEHCLAEGDATAAAFEVVRGNRAMVDETAFAEKARETMESVAPDVPVVYRESLIAAYTDGYTFVQALRKRGGFAAVNAAWKAPPTTTEQVLHLDKFDAKEPMVAVMEPSFSAITSEKEKRSWKAGYSQVVGEQGLRIVFGAWTDQKTAVNAAAGWGGDRYVLARGEGAAAGETALAWLIAFDTEADANEAARVLKAQAHGNCVDRPDLGPFAWAQNKRYVALTMGPFARGGKSAQSKGVCKQARAWSAAVANAAK